MASYPSKDRSRITITRTPSDKTAQATGLVEVKRVPAGVPRETRGRRRRVSKPPRKPKPSAGRWVALTEVLLILLFAFLSSVGIIHHELWRDETQSWLLARDSLSVAELFRNTHYEGHPLLWHYCLYGISRVSRSPFAMQMFNWLLAVGSVVLIVKKSPFSLLERALLIFGYFTFYEYALLSRSYGLGIFLAFLFCAVYCGRSVISRWRAWLMAVVLTLLANTSILGLVMSGVLAIAFYYRISLSPDVRLRKAISSYAFLLIVGWGVSAFQIGRSLFNPLGIEGFDADARAAVARGETALAVVRQTVESTLSADALEKVDKLLQIVLKSHLPLPSFHFHFWNDHLLSAQSLIHSSAGLVLLGINALLVGLLLFVSFQLLRKTPLFLSVYVLGCLSMTAIFVGAYRGATRHYGYLFILLIVCLWLAKWSRQNLGLSAPSSFATKLFTGILCVQVLAGVYAYTSDLFYPFSASYQTAQVIETQLDSLPVLAIHQRPISPISGYLDQPLYYPEAKRFGSFWDISYPEMTDEGAIAQAIRAFSVTHSDFVAVLSLPLDNEGGDVGRGLDVEYLAYIGPSIVEDEAFFLYRVQRSAT